MLIAIDGPAGAGKSTVARAVADALGFTYLDSGAMYRCVALIALRRGVALDDAAALGGITRELVIDPRPGRVMLDGENVTAAIRAPEVGEAASRISVHPQVRSAMLDRQRALFETGRYVAEGRDIGTVVAPGAELKVFLTASDDERVRRRAAQTGESAESVRESLRQRDQRDREREHAPLHAAEDAIELDTTGLASAEVTDRLVALARERGLV
jgi:cytidylate kinase